MKTANRWKKSKRQIRRWLPTAEAESGQAIVLIAFAMVVILGFTALAIDGGRLYFLHRDAQNAADAAVVAAIYALCDGQDAVGAGEAAATLNGFTTGPDTTVTVTTPYDPGSGDPDDHVLVTISSEIPPTFAQVVYDGPLATTVTAVGRCVPTVNFTQFGAVFGSAIGCGADVVSFTGSNVTMEGGVNSNSGLTLNGSVGNPSVVIGDVTLADPTWAENGITYDPPGGPQPNTPPTDPPEIWDIDDFAPGGRWANIADARGEYYSFPGNLTNISSYVTGGVMDKGIYYAAGDISLNSADLNGIDMTNVTLVARGEIKLSPDAGTVFSPYGYNENPKIAGLYPMPLAYAYNNGTYSPNYCNVNKGVTISASAMNFIGVIYAPYGLIDFSVSSGTTMYGSLVGHIVNISASSFELHFNPDLFPPIPPSGMIVE